MTEKREKRERGRKTKIGKGKKYRQKNEMVNSVIEKE